MADDLRLPVGTQVVARVSGAVGTVVAAPQEASGAYLVRLADGTELALARADLRIRKHEAQSSPTAPPPLTLATGRAYIAYQCIVGSRAYGLDDDQSDTDRRGFYLPPANLHWSLYGVPEQLEDPATEETYWEAQKFLGLALKANPNVLECLYTPLVEHAAPLAQELLAGRQRLLSRRVYQTYNGYVLSQFKRLEADIRNSGAIKWKHAMHLVRLLLAGIAALEEGAIQVLAPERERLLAIKRGALPWAEVDAWRLALHRQFDRAFAASRLPEYPDYEWANAWLLRARRRMIDG